jgi:hypothetical protein
MTTATLQHVMTLLRDDPFHLESIPDEEKTSEMCELCIDLCSEVFYCVPDHLKTPAMCMRAVSDDGWMLKYVPDELKTEELCLLALRDVPMAIKCIPPHMITHEVCRVALDSDGYSTTDICEYIPDRCIAL